MNCVERFNLIKVDIPDNVKIVAVSKYKPASLINELYQQTAHKIFGENKAQELDLKHTVLPHDIEWHFIGHLQTNKIKFIAPYVSVIQSVDSLKLLKEINKEAIKCGRIISCLLQFHIAQEEAKFGFSKDEATAMIEDSSFHELNNIKICGVMGMATFTKNEEQIRKEFKTLYNIFNTLKTKHFQQNPDFQEISMGMTDDFKIAIEEGSTIIRIGSGIFGDR
jgi:PLP dependent protein